MVCTFWGVGTLAFFTNHGYFEINPPCCMHRCLFMCIAEYYSIFFIHSAVSGYLGFQFWAIANKAAVKIHVQVITGCTMVYAFTY